MLRAHAGGMAREKGNQVIHVAWPQPQVGHSYLFVFVVERRGDRIAGGQDFVWLLDIARNPRGLAPLGDAGEVGAEPVAPADGVAGAALAREEALAVGHGDRLRLRVAWPGLHFAPAEEDSHPGG